MGGPAFALNSNTSLEMEFDDLEELKSHPMANYIMMSVDQLLQALVGKSQKEILEWKPDFSEVDSTEFQKHIQEKDYSKEKKKQLDLMQMIGDMLHDFDPDCRVELNGNIFGLGSIEYKIEGMGYGDIVNLVYRAITYQIQ